MLRIDTAGYKTKHSLTGVGEALDGRAPYKTMIKEEINIHPAPIEDKI